MGSENKIEKGSGKLDKKKKKEEKELRSNHMRTHIPVICLER